jgi:NAD-dependent dihydropyrimidine dehydrogenase PreA subunit
MIIAKANKLRQNTCLSWCLEYKMIEKIELEKCTSCGICDDVCPADVIHMEPVEVAPEIDGFVTYKRLPVIKFREHCITCFSCEIFCPEQIVDVHPSVKNRPRPW